MKPGLHVLTHRQQLDPGRVGDKVVVAIDVLFATSSMIAALAAGASKLWPAADPDQARRLAAERAAETPVLAGELMAEVPAGFAHFAPLALAEAMRPGHPLVYTSTNGAPAVIAAREATALYAGALLNAPALARRLAAEHPTRTVLLLCAGSMGQLNLEDFCGAGCLVEHLQRAAPGAWQPSDAALAAQSLYRAERPEACLRRGRIGVMMRERGLHREIAYAAEVGGSDCLPRWQGDALYRADAA